MGEAAVPSPWQALISNGVVIRGCWGGYVMLLANY
jgi:hypothetical protein